MLSAPRQRHNNLHRVDGSRFTCIEKKTLATKVKLVDRKNLYSCNMQRRRAMFRNYVVGVGSTRKI